MRSASLGTVMRYSGTISVVACIAAVAGHSAGARAEFRPDINATVAATDDSVTFAMLDARFAVSDAWLLSLAGAYLDAGSSSDEGQLRLSAIGAMSVGSWTLENRHLFSFSSASVERYRVRLRAARPGLFGWHALSARAFDEVFFDFDSRRLFRNNVAIGSGIQMTEALSAEIYHVWEMNRSMPDNTYALALMTFRFGARGGD